MNTNALAMDAASDFPMPKYRKGQKVYYPWHDTTGARHPCPDCNGSKKWTCTSPAGHTMEMDCPRCDRDNYRDELSLSYTKHTFGVRGLTIGSIKIDSDARNDRHPISYMCEETGIGSGRVYYEPDLYSAREEAEAVASAKCAAQQAERDVTPEAIRRLEYSRKPYFRALEDGVRESVRDDVRRQMRDEIESEIGEGDYSRGRWHLEEESFDSDPRFVIRVGTPDDTYGRQVCSVAGSDKYTHMVPASEAIHNARLIVKAPDMLALTQEVADEETELGEQARAILAYLSGEAA
jgi:hypothetical protein